ncbi:hypothetical protein PV748_41825, partial [Streptomyces caniscabiei]|nr:hypothetical protein [Streptomyces caniscabiei]
PDDRETVMSGSAGGRAEQDSPSRRAPRRAADPTSWLSGCRRLHRRYERKPEHFLAFTAIAATLICRRRLTN